MSRKKSPASEMNVAEKQSLPLAQRLSTLITDVSALKDCLGVSAQAINQYKLGVSRPSLENLCKIADFYGVSIDFLLGRTTVKSSNTTVRDICDYTGLTQEAVERLHGMQHYEHGTLGVSAKGYTIGHISLISDFLESRECYELLNEIAMYLIYGGALPASAYSTTEEELSIQEHERFYRWANGHGREIVLRKDICELHLGSACDKLKEICRNTLKNEQSMREREDNAINQEKGVEDR